VITCGVLRGTWRRDYGERTQTAGRIECSNELRKYFFIEGGRENGITSDRCLFKSMEKVCEEANKLAGGPYRPTVKHVWHGIGMAA
jgi:hypothetical protein